MASNHSVARYLQLRPDHELPALAGMPPTFKAIVIVDAAGSQMWQWEVSRWLVAAGCRYMMAWGADAESWRESVEDASLEAVDYEEVPAEALVLTTSHQEEEIDDVFWFARHRAHHAACDIAALLIVHISDVEKRDELLGNWAAA